MIEWAVVGHDGTDARGFVLRGARVIHAISAPNTATVCAELSLVPRILYRIGEGQCGNIPIGVLPIAGHDLAGLAQVSPPDVIDGWVRLLLIGLLQVRSQWDGVAWVILRELSHWVHLSAGEAVSCQSFLTPQLVTLLGGAISPSEASLSDTLSRPERLAAQLRTAQVTANTSATSGHLLGAELAAARPYWLGQSVSLISDSAHAACYAPALSRLGAQVTPFDSEALIAPALGSLAAVFGYDNISEGDAV